MTANTAENTPTRIKDVGTAAEAETLVFDGDGDEIGVSNKEGAEGILAEVGDEGVNADPVGEDAVGVDCEIAPVGVG